MLLRHSDDPVCVLHNGLVRTHKHYVNASSLWAVAGIEHLLAQVDSSSLRGFMHVGPFNSQVEFTMQMLSKLVYSVLLKIL